MKNYSVYLKCVNHIEKLERNLNIVVIQNNTLFRQIALNTDEEAVFSNDDEILSYDKKILVLHNVYEINTNESKIVKELYRRIEHLIKTRYEKEFNMIVEACFTLFDNFLTDFDNKIDYEYDPDLSKFFSSFSLKYLQIEKTNYLQILIEYFKIYSDLFGTEIVVSFNLSNMISNDEKDTLEKELNNIGIHLLDFTFKEEDNDFSLFSVSNDFCII